MSVFARVLLLLLALGAITGTIVWRIERQVEVAQTAIDRQPAEAMVHARRIASVAFYWQPQRLAARAMLESELRRDTSSHYARRSFEHAEQARRSYAFFWKTSGLVGFLVFVSGVLLAIGSAGKRRLALAALAGVGFTVFALGMGLL